MKSESNIRALIILLMLLSTAIIIFKGERKFLITESRGSTLSKYEDIKGFDDILLLIEDFEGLSGTDSTIVEDSIFTRNGFWSFGSVKISIDHSLVDIDPMASKSVLKTEWMGEDKFGGWGKGVGANIELDPATDYLNFRVYFPESAMKKNRIKIIIAEDDNEDTILEDDQDDSWYCKVTIPEKNQWQLVSVPLKDFADGNAGGDGIFNVTRKGGIHTITFVLDQPEEYVQGQKWYFDFITISHGMSPGSIVLKN